MAHCAVPLQFGRKLRQRRMRLRRRRQFILGSTTENGCAAGHAGPRTTERLDRDRENLNDNAVDYVRL
jgi:hypothetical protein